jgi:transcriptional regulator with PAS, ATPase and Fis domain
MSTNPTQLIGDHSSIVALRALIARVAPSKAGTVLIYGETGTGKGLVARMIHEGSQRAQKAFVDINCAAIPAELLESELFGHERGAFTGAVLKKEGLIEAGNGGSVFLDEVRELHPVMQAKILTLLDTKRFRRVGAVKPIDVDVRFIAATNKVLLQEVNAGKFRDDLYYRLQVISINIPPLRERGEDILLLADNFLHKYHQMYGGQRKQVDAEAVRIFLAYGWPGNVRELENLTERICLLEDGDRLLASHLPARILREVQASSALASSPTPLVSAPVALQADNDYHQATGHFQKLLIEQVMQACGQNMTLAADQLKLSRHALRHQMLKLGLLKDE